MSTVDPRRVGDLLPIGGDRRPPRHIRTIRRCSDRDVVWESAYDTAGVLVLRVTEDEVRP